MSNQKLDAHRFVNEAVAVIKNQVGNERVLGAVSGGIDSTVAAILAYRAIYDQLSLVFLDDGLMRDRDRRDVENIFSSLSIPVEIMDVRERFFQILRGVTYHDEKRKIFQKIFYKTLGEIARAKGASLLLHGTILTDVEETDKKIKRQHNPNIDPREYGFQGKLEPLITLRKDGVREVAKALSLPNHIVYRKPFPGPGFLVRMLGELTPEKAEILRKASPIVEEEFDFLEPFQVFPVIIGQATGIRNDEPFYGYVLGIRCVKSIDAREAQTVEVGWPVLKKVDSRILEEIPEVIQVCYCLTDKPPATIEFE